MKLKIWLLKKLKNLKMTPEITRRIHHKFISLEVNKLFIMFSRYIFIFIIFIFKTELTLAMSGKEISTQISKWLISEGVEGEPIFSKTSIYKDCKNSLQIKNMYQNYKTVKVSCLDKNGYDLYIRIKTDNIKISNNKPVIKKKNASNQLLKLKNKNKPIRPFKIFKLKKSLQKNTVLNVNDIIIEKSSKRSQSSFFSNANEIVGRKLKKNLKMGQLLQLRHLQENFDINNGDSISIISKIGNASVTVSGEAKASGNYGDLIKVKNLRSGKIIKGYVKKNKIIRVFR